MRVVGEKISRNNRFVVLVEMHRIINNGFNIVIIQYSRIYSRRVYSAQVVRFYSPYYYCGTTDETINDRRRCTLLDGTAYDCQSLFATGGWGGEEPDLFSSQGFGRLADGWGDVLDRSLFTPTRSHTLSRSFTLPLAQIRTFSLSLTHSLPVALCLFRSHCRVIGGDVTKGRKKKT